MSDSANEQDRLPTERPELLPLVESPDDRHGTRMAYDTTSRAPWYIFAAWAVFAVAYVLYKVIYLLPDLKAWFQAGG